MKTSRRPATQVIQYLIHMPAAAESKDRKGACLLGYPVALVTLRCGAAREATSRQVITGCSLSKLPVASLTVAHHLHQCYGHSHLHHKCITS